MDRRVADHHLTSRGLEAEGQDRPSRAQAQAAVRTLIRWAGNDPARQGLLATPERVVRAYASWFAGYQGRPAQLLERCFEEVAGYDEIVLLRDINFSSHLVADIAPPAGVTIDRS